MFKHLAALLLFILVTGPLSAAPSISGVSGTIQHGQVVTITGGSFGSKSPAAPKLWAPFDNNNSPSGLGLAASFNQIQNLVWDSDEGYGGAGGMKGTAAAGNGVLGSLRVDSSSPYWNASGQKHYVFHRERNNFIAYNHSNIPGDDHNMKRRRIWPNGASGYPNFTIGDYDGRVFVEQTGCSGDSGYWTSKPITNSTSWIAKEMIFKAGSGACVKDGSILERFNGVTRHSGSITTQKASPSVNWQSNYVFQAIGANVGSIWTDPPWTSALNVWVDDVYVDTTWSRVMICESATFTACRKFGLGIPSSWSANSIQATLQFPAIDFPNGTTAYAYVFDSDGVSNANGFRIVINGSVIGNPPPTITSVSISTGSYNSFVASTITGTGFLSGVTVMVGTSAATGVVRPNSTTIFFNIPPGPAGVSGLDLKTTNSDEQFAVLAATISYTAPVANQAPYNVSAGDAWEITLPATTLLSGFAEDDGLPVGTLSYLWQQKSGPGTITFADPTAIQTSAVFSSSGTYTISLTADDSDLSTESDEVEVIVHPVVDGGGGRPAGSAYNFKKP